MKPYLCIKTTQFFLYKLFHLSMPSSHPQISKSCLLYLSVNDQVLCVSVMCQYQTWWPVDGQVSEVASLDELHRHASRGGVVGESHQQLGDAAVGQRLSGGGAVALRHGGQAQLGTQRLQMQRDNVKK